MDFVVLVVDAMGCVSSVVTALYVWRGKERGRFMIWMLLRM